MKNVSLEIIDLLRAFTPIKKNCMKSILIRSYSGLYFPTFGLNAEIYGVFSQNAGKCRSEKLRIRTLFTQQKPSSKSKEDMMIDEAMFIFQYKKYKVYDPDKCLIWLLVLVFDLTGKTKSLRKKIQ